MNPLLTLLFTLTFGINALVTPSVQADQNTAAGSILSAETTQSQTDPCVIVLFGATGDLTARKLLPALYNLAREEHLSNDTVVVGYGRGLTNESFREKMTAAVDQFSRDKPKGNGIWQQFQDKIFFNQGDFEQDQGFESLNNMLAKIDREYGTGGNRIYYLATPPSYFSKIIKKLHEHELIYPSHNKQWSRVIIEKPFGHDLNSAFELQNEISTYLDESQIYRMDHYLAKEGVQNLLTLRFENTIFESLWNKEHIDNVQITLSEDIGIGTRAQFWEETGTLRDIFQNHLMQLVAIVAMEPPASLEAADIHAEKIKALNAVRPFPKGDIDQYVVRGQYGPGMIHGESVPGYKQEDGVKETSPAETYMAAKVFIDNSRWEGVPFYIRGGKRLPKQTSEIVITFKKSPTSVSLDANALFIRIQPNTSVYFKTNSKVPKLSKDVQPIIYGFTPEAFFNKNAPEAYEKLIFDAMKGNNSLYVEAEEQLIAWKLLMPILENWQSNQSKAIPIYGAGTWGPEEAEQLIKAQDHQWTLFKN